MSNFDLAIDKVLEHEGGYNHVAGDAGGETNFGISKRSYPEVDIKNLTRQQAKDIYRRDFWKYDQISSQKVAGKVFDMAVNMGGKQAHKLLQKALNACGRPVVVDGIWGSETAAACNNSNEEDLLQQLRFQAADFYASLCVANPTQLKFLRGWLKRALS